MRFNGIDCKTVVNKIKSEPIIAAPVSLVPKKPTARIVATNGSNALNIPVTDAEIYFMLCKNIEYENIVPKIIM